MEYSVNQLARLAGVSARTLRYYDEIKLLQPRRISSSGYRVYGGLEVDRLQQILFFREMDIPLERIAAILDDPNYSPVEMLESHRQQLMQRRGQIDKLIANVERTIQEKRGLFKMTDQEKFEGLKQRLVEDNHEKYGAEVSAKYGTEVYEASRKAFKNMSESDFNRMTALGEAVLEGLKEACEKGLPASSDLVQRVAQQHAEWLTLAWGSYRQEAHLGLVEMYLQDERFTAFYDVAGMGATQLLRDGVYLLLKA